MLLHESVQEGHEENGETPKEGHHNDLQQKHRTSEEKRRVLGLLSCERSRGGGRALLTPSAVLTAGWRGGRVRLFSEVQRKDKSNGHKLQQRKFHLYVGFFKKKGKKRLWVVECWNRLSSDIVKSPFLDIVKTWLDSALTLKLTQTWARSGSYWPLGDLSSLWVCLQSASLLG